MSMKRARFASLSVAAATLVATVPSPSPAPPPPSSPSASQNSLDPSVPCVTAVNAAGSERRLPLTSLLETIDALSTDDQRHLAQSIDHHLPRDVVSWLVTAAALRSLRTRPLPVGLLRRSTEAVRSRGNGAGTTTAAGNKKPPVDWRALPDSLLMLILRGDRPTENESGYLDVDDLIALEQTCRFGCRSLSTSAAVAILLVPHDRVISPLPSLPPPRPYYRARARVCVRVPLAADIGTNACRAPDGATPACANSCATTGRA